MRKISAALVAGLSLSMPLALGSTMLTVPIAYAETREYGVGDATSTITYSLDTATNTITVDGSGTLDRGKFAYALYKDHEFVGEDTLIRFINAPGAIKFPAESSTLFSGRSWSMDPNRFFKGTITGLENVDVSGVTDMTRIFGSAKDIQGISNWDVSKVRYFNYAFAYTVKIPDISNWDTSSARDMRGLFFNSQATPDLSGWNVSNVTNFGNMFKNATNANPDVYSWDMSNAKDVSEMFTGASSATGDISHWKLRNNITTTANWLEGSQLTYEDGEKSFEDLTNEALSGRVTGTLIPGKKLLIVNGGGYIDPAKLNAALTQLGLADSDNTVRFISGVRFSPDMSGAFDGWQGSFENLSGVNRNELTNATAMFREIGADTLDIGHWDMSNLLIADSMFEGATKLNVDLSAWHLASIKSMNRMFANTPALTADLSCWHTAEAKTDWLVNSGAQYDPDSPACRVPDDQETEPEVNKPETNAPEVQKPEVQKPEPPAPAPSPVQQEAEPDQKPEQQPEQKPKPEQKPETAPVSNELPAEEQSKGFPWWIIVVILGVLGIFGLGISSLQPQ
ncbi:MAG: BspA family leucine-rich repeat surface protein [Corynebacterium sp.]|nr:BspA family leucine-rich repeat surface protein [Corynebacterium sp.]